MGGGLEKHEIAWYSSAAAVLLACTLSTIQVVNQLQFNTSDKCRKYVIRILWMVPLYSVESWCGLVFYHSRLYWETLRDLYEAFVIFSFFKLLVEYLGGEDQIVDDLEDSVTERISRADLEEQRRQALLRNERTHDVEVEVGHENENEDEEGNDTDDVDSKSSSSSAQYSEPMEEQEELQLRSSNDNQEVPAHDHVFPFCWLKPWIPAASFLYRVKWGTLQYVYVKFISAILRFLLESFDVYGDGQFSPSKPYFYDVIANNVSQVWALYCLALFYLSTKKNLTPIKPVPKFLCIKLVVFFTFWQSMVIVGMEKLNLIPRTVDYSEDDVAAGLQNFMICWEMLVAAIAHHFVFVPSDFDTVIDERERKPLLRALGSAMNVTDVFTKEKPWVKKQGSKRKHKKSRKGGANRYLHDDEDEEHMPTVLEETPSQLQRSLENAKDANKKSSSGSEGDAVQLPVGSGSRVQISEHDALFGDDVQFQSSQQQPPE